MFLLIKEPIATAPPIVTEIQLCVLRDRISHISLISQRCDSHTPTLLTNGIHLKIPVAAKRRYIYMQLACNFVLHKLLNLPPSSLSRQTSEIPKKVRLLAAIIDCFMKLT